MTNEERQIAIKNCEARMIYYRDLSNVLDGPELIMARSFYEAFRSLHMILTEDRNPNKKPKNERWQYYLE